MTGVQTAGLQVRPGEVHELAEPGEVEHAADLVGVGLGQAQAAQQEQARAGGHRALDLDANGLAEPPPPELLLDRHEEVVRLVLLEREVGVARHPEQVVLEHLHAREQGVEIGLDDLVDQHEARRLHLEEAGQDLGHLHAGEAPFAGLRVAQADRDRQAQRRDVRERVAGVDGERREDRVDLVEEALSQRLVVLRDRGVLEELDAFGSQRPPDIDVDRGVVGDELEDPRASRRELLLGRPAVGRTGDAAGLELLTQAGDADLEELVEVAREDRQELDPLEQRIPRVARLVEHPGVELQPRELAVEVGVRAFGPRRAALTEAGDAWAGACAGIDGGHAAGRLLAGLVRAPWGPAARIARPDEPPAPLERPRTVSPRRGTAVHRSPGPARRPSGCGSSGRRIARPCAGSVAPSAGLSARRRRARAPPATALPGSIGSGSARGVRPR